MPRIPTSNERQVKEQISQGKGFQARMGNTTRKENLGADVAGAVAQVSGIVQREQIKAEETQANEYKLKLRNKKIELTHDKDKGFFKERGKNAALNEKTYSDEFRQYGQSSMEEYAGASDRLKAKLSLINESFQTDLKAQYSSHTARQNEIYETEMFESEMKSLHNEALLDNSKIGSAIQEQKNLIYGRKDKNGEPLTVDGVPVQPGIAAQKGLSKERADQMFLKATTSLHTEVLGKMMNSGQDKLAKDYYQVALKNNEISGEAAVGIEKALNASSIKGESQRQTEAIINQGMNTKDSLAEARKISDPELRDETVRRVKNRLAENKQIEKQQQMESFENVANQLEKTGSLDSIPIGQLESMGNTQRQALIRREAQLAKGVTPKTDLTVYYQLEQLAGENKDAFRNVSLLEFRDKLSESDFKKFSKMKSDLLKGGEDSDKLMDGIQTKNSIINGALTGMGIQYSGRSASKESVERSNLFRRKVDEAVIDKQEELGRKVNNKELRDIVGDLRVNVITEKGFFFDDKKRMFEVTENDMPTIDFDDIPNEQVNKIKRVLRDRGQEESEDNIAQFYALKLSKRLGRNGN
jgi:hypothetical protein